MLNYSVKHCVGKCRLVISESAECSLYVLLMAMETVEWNPQCFS